MSDNTELLPENIQLALGYSRTFATAKPNIGLTEKEHIIGLSNLLEKTALKLQSALAQQPTPVAVPADSVLRARVADLLHLLQFAKIETPSQDDAAQAEIAMNDLERMLAATAAPARVAQHADDAAAARERDTLRAEVEALRSSHSKAANDVLAERRRQVEAEGWTPEHDDEHDNGQMARAAACYALAGSCEPHDEASLILVDLAWPWAPQWWKPAAQRRDLVKAGALILAEIERLDRAAMAAKEGV